MSSGDMFTTGDELYDKRLGAAVASGAAVALAALIGAVRYQRMRRESGTRHPILLPSEPPA
jgi:hypothetical protein